MKNLIIFMCLFLVGCGEKSNKQIPFPDFIIDDRKHSFFFNNNLSVYMEIEQPDGIEGLPTEIKIRKDILVIKKIKRDGEHTIIYLQPPK
jgi:hypothetical protein